MYSTRDRDLLGKAKVLKERFNIVVRCPKDLLLLYRPRVPYLPYFNSRNLEARRITAKERRPRVQADAGHGGASYFCKPSESTETMRLPCRVCEGSERTLPEKRGPSETLPGRKAETD